MNKDMQSVKEFEWKNYEIVFKNKELHKIESKTKKTTFFTIILNVIASIILFLALLVRLLRFCLRIKNHKIYGLRVNYINDLFILYCISFLFISLITKGCLYIIFNYPRLKKYSQYSSVIEIFSIELWILLFYLSIPSLIPKDRFLYYDNLIEYFSHCIMFGPIFIITSFIFKKAEIHYLNKSIKSSVVEQTENILLHIKNFYEIGKGSSSISSISDCFIDIQTIEKKDNLRLLNDSDNDMLLKEPVFNSAKEASKVADKVFQMLSPDKDNLIDLKAFSCIFNDVESSMIAFSYFDSRKDQKVSRRIFKDRILYFYQLRFYLTKTLKSKKQFINLLTKISYALITLLIIIIQLLFSGYNFSKILTFLFSTGFTIQLFGTKIIDVFVKSMLLIISHPFDIGDDVLMDDAEYKIGKMGLFNTTMLKATGGVIKVSNSDLWSKSIINLTKSPENKLLFEVTLPSNVNLEMIKKLDEKVTAYLGKHEFDFLDSYELINNVSNDIKIVSIKAMIILQCRGYKNRSKRLLLRIDFSNFLANTLKELGFYL